jgi:short-subunit dehydrogenase
MNNRPAVVFGSNGGIGRAVVDKLSEQNYSVISVGRDSIDLATRGADQKIIDLLNSVQPCVVVNAAGVYMLGAEASHTECFNVNVGTNWSIIRHYMKNVDQSVVVVMVGSSSYQSGRPLYPLYSASKAAVFNLWQSSMEFFNGSSVNVHLINPVRTRTKMVEPYHKQGMDYLEAEDVADKILDLISIDGCQCVDMNYKESK